MDVGEGVPVVEGEGSVLDVGEALGEGEGSMVDDPGAVSAGPGDITPLSGWVQPIANASSVGTAKAAMVAGALRSAWGRLGIVRPNATNAPFVKRRRYSVDP